MNYYGPRQIESGPSAGKWHYTCRNDDRVWAVGHCAPHRACETCSAAHGFPADPKCPECAGRGLVPVEEPCPGHDTAAGACAHYKEYLLDERLRFWEDRPDADMLYRCEVPDCREMTSGGASVGAYWSWHLCVGHRSRYVVDALMGEVGESFGSS